jgi:hypothetical protein
MTTQMLDLTPNCCFVCSLDVTSVMVPPTKIAGQIWGLS